MLSLRQSCDRSVFMKAGWVLFIIFVFIIITMIIFISVIVIFIIVNCVKYEGAGAWQSLVCDSYTLHYVQVTDIRCCLKYMIYMY